MRDERIDHDLYRGTLDIIVLALIAEQADHGYGLIERLKAQSGGVMEISEGAIYPLLHRLQVRKLIDCEWAITTHNRRAKKYLITDAGRRVLLDRAKQWRTLTRVIEDVIGQLNPARTDLVT